MPKQQSELFSRIETEIDNYTTNRVELSEGVFFSQYKTINRIYKFKNRDLSGSKLNEDLSYNYYFDIISPRADSEVKNLRFDSKNILAFSTNPRKDFAAVFISNASLKNWMAENGEDEKLKDAVEEFVANGNIGFKKVDGGYETVDALNTFITNQKAKTINETDLIERHEKTASDIVSMTAWDQEVAKEVIKNCGNKFFSATTNTTQTSTTGKKYELFEFTGEVSEKEFNLLKEGAEEGDEHKYFLAKVVIAGLKKGGAGEKYVLFAEKLVGKMDDYYIYAHRGRYEGRFWRIGMYELLFDHQIRANEIGNDLARGLEWASKVIFKSKDGKILQNIRADLDNGDVVITEDLSQVDVRMRNLDQLIADWNRVMQDADRLANSMEVVRGENPPSGTPFRSLVVLDQNAGKLFVLIRQKLSLPFKRVFREWVLPELIKDLKGEDVFLLTGETDLLDQLREIMVESWYIKNLVQIGPHTREQAEAIKAEKLDELRRIDPTIKNVQKIWQGVKQRLYITITGENSDIQDQLQDMVNLLSLEQEPERINWLLDTIYRARNIPIPPRRAEQPAETQLPNRQQQAQEQAGLAANNQPTNPEAEVQTLG